MRAVKEMWGAEFSFFHEDANQLLEYPTSVETHALIKMAGIIAKSKRQRVIDTASFLHALIRKEFYGHLLDETELKSAALTPIKHVFGGGASRDVKAWGLRVLKDEVKFGHHRVTHAGGLLSALAPHLQNGAGIDQLEQAIVLARTVEPYVEYTKLALLPGKKGIRLRQFDYLNSYELPETRDGGICKVNTVCAPGIMTWDTIHDFEVLINRRDTTEWDLQKFFERHPQFLLGSHYSHLHSQVALVKGDGTELVPDFFAERVGTGYADIIELKRPSARLVSGCRGRKGIAASITRALNQVREYRNYFDDASVRRRFHNRYGFDAFRPAIIVVIGRARNYLDQIERIRIEDEYRNLQVLTYDDILRRARQLAVWT